MSLIDQLRPHPTCTLVTAGNVVKLAGVLRDADVGVWLRPVIQEVHRNAMARALEQVIVDIRQVEYANASAWKCFVYWLRLLEDEDGAAYTLKLLCDESRRWQSSGVPFLSVFSQNRLSIEMS